MCRVGGEVECQEVSVAWLRDNNNKHVMAVRTDLGWREIMVSARGYIAYGHQPRGPVAWVYLYILPRNIFLPQ